MKFIFWAKKFIPERVKKHELAVGNFGKKERKSCFCENHANHRMRPFLLSSIFPFRDQQRFAFYDIWIGYMGYKILKKSFKSSQKAYPTFFVLLNLWAVEDVDWLKEGKSAAALCFDFKIRLNNWLAHQMKFYPVLGAFFCKCWQFNMAFK